MMRRLFPFALLAAFVPMLSGCVVATLADAAVDVVTLPVKAVSKGVDLATTSQSEADEKRGRLLRKQEERRGKALRTWRVECDRLTAAGQPCPPAPSP